MRRRSAMIGGGSILAALPFAGCAAADSSGPLAPKGTSLIDVHCHIFNGSDLPAVRFVKIVVLEHYPKQAIKALDIDDPDALDGLIALFIWIVGETKAPSADDEIKVLDGQAAKILSHADEGANEAAFINALANFTKTNGVAAAGGVDEAPIRKIRRAILKAAGEDGVAAADKEIGDKESKLLAERAFRSKFDLGLLLRWFALFTRYRYSLADKLAADHAAQNFKPLLLCPATVDYDNWLGEHVDKSPMPSQVAVMGRIARRTSGPAVHGYVAFDPLRQVLFDAGLRKDFDPLALVQRAIRDEGFIGVKVYPPMGFRAQGNADDKCQTYPDTPVFKKLLGAAPDDPLTKDCKPVRPANGSVAISRKLDDAMRRMFDLCQAEHGCVLAHANDSNGSALDYSHRADPTFWLPVFKDWPKLHVCLAHFGHFASRAATAPPGQSLPEASWEWVIGAFLKANPESPLFCDVSYLTEIFGKPADELAKYTAVMRRWLLTFDPDCRHVMFGTDWIMLGLDASYPVFSGTIYEYFRAQVGLDADRLQRLFVGNAARFLGLRVGDDARNRIEQFYVKHGLPRGRLAAFAA